MPRPAFGGGDSTSIISEKGAGMAIKDVLPRLRRERGLTQEDLAKKLFITRQAVSRWETGETAPGIDMTKLIAVTLDVPVTELLEMPEHYCQSCGMMFTAPDQHGHEADGTEVEDFCRWCYDDGAYTYETTMERWVGRLTRAPRFWALCFPRSSAGRRVVSPQRARIES